MSRTYEDFEPASEWVHEEDCDTLLVYLGGFKKEQLRAQLTTPRNLVVSGERPLGKNKWRRFQKVFTISENCDTDKITAKFEDSVLTVKQPKLITTAQKQDQEKPITTTTTELAPKAPQNLQPPQPQPQPPQNNIQQQQPQPPPPPPPPQKNVQQPQPPPPQTNVQQQPQASNIDDQEATSSKADMANRGNEKTDDGLAKPKTVNVPDQKLQHAQEKDNNMGNGKIRSEREKSSSLSSDGRSVDQEKEKISAGKTLGTEKREVPSTATRRQVGGGIENPLKIPKQLMNLVLVLLCVIVLGLYVSNSIRSYKKPEN